MRSMQGAVRRKRRIAAKFNNEKYLISLLSGNIFVISSSFLTVILI